MRTTSHRHVRSCDAGHPVLQQFVRGGVGGRRAPRDVAQVFTTIGTIIYPGDELVTHCEYDSTARSNATLGGQGTYDEMCLNTVIFYPKSHFNEDNMKAALAVLPQRDDGVLADNGGINV